MLIDKRPYSFRYDHKVPEFDDSGPVCVMDAHCSLCARGAKWISRNDTREEFKIVPLQSEMGKALMRHYGMDASDPTSWLYIVSGQAYSSLDALVRVGHQLGGVWNVLLVLRVIPRSLRDSLYTGVARNRYRWFGTTDLCSLPDPEVQKRLLL